MYLFGLHIPDEKSVLCFIICSGGIYFFYIVQGYASETLKQKKALQYGWFVTLFQCTTYAILALAERTLRSAPPRKAHVVDYLKIGFLQVIAVFQTLLVERIINETGRSRRLHFRTSVWNT